MRRTKLLQPNQRRHLRQALRRQSNNPPDGTSGTAADDLMADREAFLRAMEDVRPLDFDGIEPHQNRPRPFPHSTLADEQQVLADLLSDGFHPEDLETGEDLHYIGEGVQHQVARKLRRGGFSVGAELDLHGFTAESARLALQQFINQARHRGITCVRIIHGKGLRSSNRGPVLKHRVNHWLRQRADVLAFSSARPHDGGTGAIYVLLKAGR